MRLLILNHNEENSGTFFRCFSIAKQLSKLGVHTSLACLSSRKMQFSIKHKKNGGVSLKLLVAQHGKSSFSELPFHIYRSIQNIYLIISERYDFVYFFNVASPTIAIPLLLLKPLISIGIIRTRIIIDWDDLWGINGLTSIEKKGMIIESVADFLERKLPKLGEKLTVASTNIRKKAIKNGINKSKLYYLPNGANINPSSGCKTEQLRESLNLPKGRNILCFVGRAPWTISYLLESFEFILKDKPNTILIVITPDTGKSIRSDLPKNAIRWLGTLPYNKMQKYLLASDILLLPRIPSEVEKYNCPARLGDYLAAGKPIVSTSIGDEAERIIKRFNAGLMAKAKDPYDFSKQVIKLIKNRKLREEIGNNNRFIAEKTFSWNSLIANFYQDVLLSNK